jgi:hypothetical protein
LQDERAELVHAATVGRLCFGTEPPAWTFWKQGAPAMPRWMRRRKITAQLYDFRLSSEIASLHRNAPKISLIDQR